MTCLETTFLVDLLRGDSGVQSLMEELERTETSLAAAAPSVMEIWTGALLSKFTDKEKAKVKDLILSLIILPLDEKSSIEAGEIAADMAQKGITIDPVDLMIAGVVRASGEKLVTRDQDYAKIPGLRVLKY